MITRQSSSPGKATLLGRSAERQRARWWSLKSAPVGDGRTYFYFFKSVLLTFFSGNRIYFLKASSANLRGFFS